MTTSAPPAPTVLCVGETMGMITSADASGLATATDVILDVGGAESNVAMHLASLGDAAAWASALGGDAVGERVLRRVASAGVDVSRVAVRAGERTGLYLKDPGRGAVYYRAGSAASKLSADDAAALDLDGVGIVHLSGITVALSDDCRAFVDELVLRAHERGALVSFDVNHRAALWPDLDTAARTLREYAEAADVVFVGLDEAQGLWQVETAADVRALLPGGLLVVKDGADGATEFGVDAVFVPTPPVADIVEPVGAGDAFAAGWLHGFVTGMAAAERLGAGHARAAVTLRSPGDLPDDIVRA